jgi:hypothetical protein
MAEETEGTHKTAFPNELTKLEHWAVYIQTITIRIHYMDDRGIIERMRVTLCYTRVTILTSSFNPVNCKLIF